MNDLVKVPYDNEQRPTVMGRDPHEAQGIRSNHKDWFSRMCAYGFTESTDFISILRESTGGQPSMDRQQSLQKRARAIIMRKKSVDCRKIGSLFSYVY